jgi:ATP-dependent Lon protease
VPDGATPKDGPSAGAAMTTAFVSALTGIPVRADVAMTGEITLRGEVTAIGGLKEKLLAAARGGIRTVMIPEENTKDLQDIPENVKSQIEIVPVKWIDKVLEVALESMPRPLPEEEPAKDGAAPAVVEAAAVKPDVVESIKH